MDTAIGILKRHSWVLLLIVATIVFLPDSLADHIGIADYRMGYIGYWLVLLVLLARFWIYAWYPPRASVDGRFMPTDVTTANRLITRHALKFCLLTFGLIAAGLLFLAFHEEIHSQLQPFSGKLIEEIGKVFITAGILALSVDGYLKRRLISEFVKDVSPYIEGIGLPREFQDEIAYIKRMKVYRRNFTLNYRIQRDPDHGGRVIVKSTSFFEVVNPTDEDQMYTLEAAVGDEPGLSAKLVCGYTPFKPDGTQEAIYFHGKLNEKTRYFEIREKIRVPVGHQIKCWADSETSELEKETETTYLTNATVGITVLVDAPRDFLIDVDIGHRYMDTARVLEVSPAEPGGLRRWELDAALLPWHSVTVEWKPRDVAQRLVEEEGSTANKAAQENKKPL